MADSAAFYDAAWSDWDDMLEYGPTNRHIYRLKQCVLSGLPFASVLDVGCGSGLVLRDLLQQRPNIEVAGVDVSPRAVEMSRRRLPSGTFAVLDVTAEHLTQQFDLVICTEVLEHIPDDLAALRNIRAMCRHWCMVTSVQGPMGDWERNIGHVRNYARGELQGKLLATGFNVIRTIEWGWPLYNLYRRHVLARVPFQSTVGHFGWKRRLLSRALYAVMFANLRTHGDYVICLAESR